MAGRREKANWEGKKEDFFKQQKAHVACVCVCVCVCVLDVTRKVLNDVL